MYFSQDCTFHVNFLEGSNSLFTQLRRRSQALKRLSRHFPLHFNIQLVNALLYGKLRYNIVTWGNLSKKNKDKVDKVISQTVSYVTRGLYFGKDIKWIMKKHNLMNFDQLYWSSQFKQTYTSLNNKDDNIIKNIIIENRTTRNLSENKCGTIGPNIGWNLLSQNSFEYRMKTEYNKLNRNVTLAPNNKLFKKYIDRHMFDKQKILPNIQDNKYFTNKPMIDTDEIMRCQ